ncbi:MAG: hypothetical protein OXJ37_21295 [Bryobacterales bacterium]|nr:hypothetical protein [Bryobacterales bacterium]
MAFPPVPAPSVTADLSALLDRARLALWRLDGAFSAHSDAPAFEAMQLLREAVLSCRIESESSGFAAVLAAAVDLDDEPGGDAIAPMRCRKALECGLTEASEEPLTLDRLAAVEAALAGDGASNGGLAGRAKGDRETKLAAALVELDEFLMEQGELPDLVRIGIAQAQLARLLPTGSQDGRLERIAGLAMFRRIGVPGASALAMSPYFQSSRSEYQAQLRGPTETWLDFFVKAVAQSANEAAGMIRRCAVLAREHREAISAGLGHAVGRGLRVFGRLTTEPVATVSEIQDITGTSYVATNQLVARFVDMGILDEITGYRRNRRFQYGPYVRVFDPDATAAPAPERRAARPVSKPPRRPAARKPPRRRAVSGPRKPSPAPPSPKPRRRPSPSFSDHLL